MQSLEQTAATKVKVEYRETQSIDFSQATVSAHFSNGSTLKELIDKLLTNQVDVNTIPPIRIVQQRNRWISLDNRRLRAFKDAFVIKIPVIVCNLKDENIKKEFFAKKTNKSLTGGEIRHLDKDAKQQNFDDGVYIFTKQVLNWTIDQLKIPYAGIKNCTPLPDTFLSRQDYYGGFLPIILEEARAVLASGIEILEKNAAEKNISETFELTLHNIKTAKKDKNPSLMCFTKGLEDKITIKPNDAFLLEYRAKQFKHSIQLLGLVIKVPDINSSKIVFKAVLDKAQVEDIPEAFENQAKWKVKAIGSLVTQLRMYDVCTTAPDIDWLDALLSGDLKDQPKNTPIVDISSSIKINTCQKQAIQQFLELQQGIQLVQGPPGTGKTTMICNLLKPLISQGKVLVCAPSNKAIQVLADKFLTENSDVPIMLTGVEDKLPKEHDRLQEIFLHSWGDLQLQQISRIKSRLWELIPDKLVDAEGSELKTKYNLDHACSEILKIKKDFLLVVKNFKKYGLIVEEQAVSNFEIAVKEYWQYTTRDHNFHSSLLRFIKTHKKIDFSKKVFLDSGLPAYFSKLKTFLNEVNHVLNDIESAVQNMTIEGFGSELEVHLLQYSQIVFSTLSVSGRKSIKELADVQSLIIDEAGQATEAESLIPLSVKPKKCLLVGDTKQLPATIISPEAVKLKFERSMMSRLVEDCKQEPLMLTTQYRMHPEIRQLPSFLYYDNKLQDAPNITERLLKPFIKSAPGFVSPYSFINVPGKENHNGHSFENKEEALFITKMINHLEKQYNINPQSQIGVITFYKSQVSLLQNCLKIKFPNVKIQTVDSFQGDESDIIIISFVRANLSGKIGFVNDFRRLNVALTRAKHALIMVGDASTLIKTHKNVQVLVKNAIDRKCYYEQSMVEKEIAPQFSKAAMFAKKKPQCDFLHAEISYQSDNVKTAAIDKPKRFSKVGSKQQIDLINSQMQRVSISESSSNTAAAVAPPAPTVSRKFKL